jgi:hypothetical protein
MYFMCQPLLWKIQQLVCLSLVTPKQTRDVLEAAVLGAAVSEARCCGYWDGAMQCFLCFSPSLEKTGTREQEEVLNLGMREQEEVLIWMQGELASPHWGLNFLLGSGYHRAQVSCYCNP